MRNELSYFKIEDFNGGNQRWFRDPTMHIGGCAAVTACDIGIYLALNANKKHLYPYDINKLSKADYIRFSKRMKPFLRPRLKGIKTLKLYMAGFIRYLQDVGETGINITEFSGEMPVDKAKDIIKVQIDNKIPIPYLLLKHKSINMSDFTWHWFLLVGYEEIEEDFYVKIATYGKFYWLSLYELWKTDYNEKGGMIIIA